MSSPTPTAVLLLVLMLMLVLMLLLMLKCKYTPTGVALPLPTADPQPPDQDSLFTPMRPQDPYPAEASSTDTGGSSTSAMPGTGPRKRADDVQLAVLNAAFEQSAYPSTAERQRLARRLGMTSRSVQIWFQNRRRAIKVEQQSSAQRIEAELIATRARERGLPGPPYLHEAHEGLEGDGVRRDSWGGCG
ncbi:hypothetical protein JCM24511_07140 [Saitozyma sp. JCM 24511]|nr:hypothetical protein JCM24511_07140 [Saitozyma sp. JCM 24511]